MQPSYGDVRRITDAMKARNVWAAIKKNEIVAIVCSAQGHKNNGAGPAGAAKAAASSAAAGGAGAAALDAPPAVPAKTIEYRKVVAFESTNTTVKVRALHWQPECGRSPISITFTTPCDYTP